MTETHTCIHAQNRNGKQSEVGLYKITASSQVKVTELAVILTVSPRKRKCDNRAIRDVICHLLTPELVSSEWIINVTSTASEVRLLTVTATVVHRVAVKAATIK